MVGIVKHVPSHSRMLPLAEAFQASDFNLHAYPLFFVKFNCLSRPATVEEKLL